MFDLNNEYTVKHILDKEIQLKQISKTEMSKRVYSKTGGIGYVSTEEIILNEEEIKNIIYWINPVSESEVTELKQIPNNTSISAGIIIGLEANKEIRIQYDLEKIYITRTDIKGKGILYTIDKKELKSFFNEKLKGFYFGEDNIKVF
ncbi:hypothetical protein [Paenibacillus endoradicis]|uniref:hypothetical protein n=1 Tax=Paenibacillus endoradicis TaxID=2972487 RepID=UPI002159711B|nr:hypothetical protein [Paenibacillus endoradicis]MCR8656701.1 hypothetical protein [Paenibacillus endoradicis]